MLPGYSADEMGEVEVLPVDSGDERGCCASCGYW